MSKILHFGCWGLNGPDLTKNMNMIKSMDLSKYDFLSIAGDNYYKQRYKYIKNKRIKINKYTETDLVEAFNTLPRDIDIIMINGNHDVDDVFFNAKKCTSLFKQNNLIKHDFKNITKYNDVAFKKIKDSLFIFFDSTLYDLPDDIFIKNTCYSHMHHSRNFRNIKDLRRAQNKKIQNILKEQDCKNLFFVCHHPIVYIKASENTHIDTIIDTDYTVVLFKFSQFLEDNIKLLENKIIYHLCADNHMYQKGLIKLGKKKSVNINQIVAGTGGGFLYDIPISNKISIPYYNIKMEIYESISSHGVVEITINDKDNDGNNKSNIDVKFIEMFKQNGGSVSIKKKYLILKKLIQ